MVKTGTRFEEIDIHEVSGSQDGPVTAVFRRHIRPGHEVEYEAWLRRLTALATGFSGYLGSTVLRPSNRSHPEFVAIVRFATAHELLEYENAPPRLAALEELKGLLEAPDEIEHSAGLEIWFSEPDRPAPRNQPSRWKMWVLLTVCLFVIQLTLVAVLGPLLVHIPWPLDRLLLAVINVWLMTYYVLPYLTKLFAGWLFR